MFPTYTSALGTFRDAVGSVPYLIGRSDGRSHMTIFSGPTGPKILLTQNQVIMPYRVPQNDFLLDRSANADRSHMTIFSGPTGPKILLAQNQVIMPYPVRFRLVGDGFPVPPSATAGAADLALPLGDGIA